MYCLILQYTYNKVVSILRNTYTLRKIILGGLFTNEALVCHVRVHLSNRSLFYKFDFSTTFI